jgi:hypothetical protein
LYVKNVGNYFRKPVFNKSVSIKWLSDSVNIASQVSIVEVGNKHGNGEEFPDFVDLLFFLA